MRTPIVFLLLPLFYAATLFAQQAQWEIVRENLYGQIAVDPQNANVIYVCPGDIENAGLYKSIDAGATWTLYQNGYQGLGDVAGILIDPTNTQRLWVYGGPFRGISRSEDGGMTAVRSDSGIYFSGHHGYMIVSMAYDHQRDIIYVGDYSTVSGGLLRSFDGGWHWEVAASFDVINFVPTSLVVIEENGWLLSAGRNVWRSKDFGKTWGALGTGKLAETLTTHIARVPGSNTLYCTGRLGGVFKSYDLGENWFSVSTALTDSGRFEGGLVVSSLDTNYVFLGSIHGGVRDRLGGVYLSKSGGNDWQIYFPGFPDSTLFQWSVRALAQSSSPYYLYSILSFPSKSLYRLSQEMLITSVEERSSAAEAKDFVLHQNYPNPFNAQTRIEFSLMRKAKISLDVYDISGDHLSNLLNGEKPPGHHSVVWNGKIQRGGDASSGIYICCLKAGKETSIRKLLIIR